MTPSRWMLIASLTLGATAPAFSQNIYRQVNLVSNRAEDKPEILDPLLLNAWGITIRPAGAGGHWWVTNAGSGTVTTYVGDVPGVPLYQDELKWVDIPSSKLYSVWPETVSQPTGQVYSGWSSTDFVISGEGVTGSSKFIFCTLDGSVSGWREGQTKAVNMIDLSVEGSMFTGMAITEKPEGNRIYLCDVGLEKVHVYDHLWRPVTTSGGFHDPNVPAVAFPFNMQYLQGRLFVAWGHIGDDPGEEDAYPGYGYISEFDEDGNLLASYEKRRELNAPWGLAIAPSNFGGLSNMLLVSNFGDGTIIAFDLETKRYVDYLRGVDGRPVAIDGIWGLIYGNGVRLGVTNHLYFAAGPNVETDGLFGKFVPLVPRAGDVDGNGLVNNDDRQAFELAISDAGAFAARYPAGVRENADCNLDGVSDSRDRQAFLRLLLRTSTGTAK